MSAVADEPLAAALATGAAKAITRADLARKCAAEAIGTFALVFAGCGAIMIDALTGGGVSHVGIGLTFGLVIMVMIYATGHISGAHFNPAVTVAFAAIGRFPWRQVPFYVGAQIAAALVAAWALAVILGPVGFLGATLPAGSAMQSLLLEGVITFFLMFVITAVATDSRAVGSMAGWAIGGTVRPCRAIFAGPISRRVHEPGPHPGAGSCQRPARLPVALPGGALRRCPGRRLRLPGDPLRG